MKKIIPIVLILFLSSLLTRCYDPYEYPCYNEYSAEQDSADQQAIREYIEREQMTGVIRTSSGLSYYIYEPGDGVAPREESTIIADYVGSRIKDETHAKFDSCSYGCEFVLSETIPGWIEGLQLIKEGGRIRLMIPSHLAYGNCGSGAIAPNTPLVFDVNLIAVRKY